MTLDAFDCFRSLQLTPADNDFIEDWAQSAEREWPLAHNELRETCDYCGFPEDLTDEVMQAWQDITRNPQLERIALHAWYALETEGHKLYVFPVNHEGLSPLLGVTLVLQAIPALRQRFAERDIADEYCRDLMSDVLIWIEDHKNKNNCYGFEKLDWLYYHIRFKIFKLGRLQFEPFVFKNPVVVFTAGDKLRIACLAGQSIASDGLFASANTKANPGFETTWQEDDESWSVHCFDEQLGLVEAAPSRLLKSDWSIAIQQGDELLSVHIPATGPMTIDSCAESFAHAPEFFAQHFPELSLKGFYCSSWLLSPYFSDYLKPTSNMVLFMKSWHRFAKPDTNDKEFFGRVWGTTDVDVKTAAQDTSLQRCVIAHVEAGGVWNDMGGIRLIDQLPFAPLA